MITITVKSISVINKMSGPVFIINGNGDKVQLQLGDKVTPGQVIQAQSYDSVHLIPVDEVLEPAAAVAPESELPVDVADEIAALQEALLAGVDPTTSEDFEASAAGVEASSNAGGGNSSSSIGGSSGISRTGEETISTAGYDTSGLVRDPVLPIDDTESRNTQNTESEPSVTPPVIEPGVIPPNLPTINVAAVNNALDSDVNNVVEGNDIIFSIATENTSGGTLTLGLNEGSASAGEDFANDLEYSLDGGNTWLSYPDSGIQIGDQETILVRVPTLDDAIQEAPEDLTLNVGVTTPQGSASESADVIIHDDTGEQALQPGTDASAEDTVFVTLSGPTSVAEGEQTSPYTITLSEPLSAGQSITVQLSYTGSAQLGADFNGISEITINGPANSFDFNLDILEDIIKEGLESFTISISDVVDNQGAFEAISAADGSSSVTTEVVDNDLESTIVIDQNITADDIINAAEAGQPIPVTGKASGDFQAGDTVTLTVNGKTFTGPVDADGNFSINVPGADLVADSDKVIDASLAATDAAGNSTTVTDSEGYSVDTEMTNTAITLDEDITADDIINAAEAGQQIPVTGKATGDFQAGDTVTLTVNGKTFTGPVDADGNFSINVPGADLVADSDKVIDASLAATDAAGNSTTVTDSEGYSVDTEMTNTAITLDEDITADDIINAAEAGQPIPVTGKATGDFQAGDTVTLTVNGKTFTGPVDADGNFSINVPGADLAADPDTTIDASLAATDAAGNSTTVTDSEGYSVDTEMTNTAITLDEDITADDIINAAEAGQQIPVTGKATGDFQAGDTVTLTVNGKTFTGPVDADGNFSINVPGADLVADSDKVIDASLAATDAAGNSTTVTDTEGYSVDTEMTNTAITLDEDITADDIINAAEAGQQIPVTGKASGDFQAGDTVTLTVNGKTFSGPVDADGNFSINVPGADLAADPDTTIEASLVATDVAGNSTTVTDSEGYSVDTEMTATAVTLDEDITADDIINAAEAGQQIPVTGKASGDFQAGDIVTLTVNGKTFTGPVDADGNFSINVPGADLAADSDKVIDASLAATDAAGNSTTVTDTEGYSVDTVMKDTAITLDANITADDSISLAEGNQTIAITGQVTGDFQVDDIVTLTINNNTYTGKVAANGSFSIDVAGSDLVNDADSIILASLAATDAAGNTITVTDTEGYTVPPVAVVDAGSVNEAYGQPANDTSASITGDVLTNDRTLGINNPVVGVQAGTAAGDASGNLGSTVQGQYGSLVLNADGSYEYVLDNQNASVQGLNDGQTLTDTFSYTITDGKGNSSTTQINITINGITDPELQAIDDSASSLVGQPVYVDILGNDINPADSNTGDQNPEMTVSNVNVVSGAGQAYFIDGELVYIPGPSEETAVIEYTITNLQGQTDTATVTIDVTQRVIDSGTLYGDAGNDQISTTSGGDADSTSFTLQLGAYQGYRTDADGNRVYINEGSRIETLVLAEEEQIIDSKGGNDYVKGSLGADTIFLGDGYQGNEANTIAYLDEMAKKDESELQTYHTGGVSSAVVDIADGGAGDDVIFGGNQTPDDPNYLIDDLERPIAHYDFIYGNDGDDMIDGGLGHDVIKGGTGNDILIGGDGNDDITGGSGNDILIGGDGADTFRFFEEDATVEAGNTKQDDGIVDTIMDFDVSQDKLDLSDLLDTQGADVSSSIDQYLNVIEEDGHVVIEVDKDGSGQFNGNSDMKISLENVDYATHGSSLLNDLMDNNQLIVDIN